MNPIFEMLLAVIFAGVAWSLLVVSDWMLASKRQRSGRRVVSRRD